MNLTCESRIMNCTAQIFAQAYKTRSDQGTSVICLPNTIESMDLDDDVLKSLM